MKRLIFALIVSLGMYAPALHASPDMAKMWGEEASFLEADTVNLITALDRGGDYAPSDAYILNVSRFGRTSKMLASWNDASGGPQDLGCILRGMSTEAEDQTLGLIDAESSSDARTHLKRLEGMFADAQLIARAAEAQSATPTLSGNHRGNEACPMELEAARRALQ
ncbi:MAG: hypothetical protein AAF296_01470 [Pseudomonadota bacterium]